MSCPTCDHTMQRLAGTSPVWFWCPRCGTIAEYNRETGKIHPEADRPKLVERCREFEKTFPPGNPPTVSYSQEWKRLGVAEAINTPEDRP